MFLAHTTTFTEHTESIEQLRAVGLTEVELAALQADGFSQFHSSSMPAWQLAANALTQMFNELDCDPSSIQLVVIATETHWDNPESALDITGVDLGIRDDYVRSLTHAGLSQCEVLGVWLNGCANVSSALSVIQARLHTGEIDNALLVTVDRFKTPSSRLIPPLRTERIKLHGVASDIATASLITAKQPEGLSYRCRGGLITSQLAVREKFEAMQQQEQASKDFAYIIELSKLIKASAQRFQQQFGQPLSACSSVITGNYVKQEQQLFWQGLGLNSEQVMMPSKAAIGHCVSSDLLVSLQRMKTRSDWVGSDVAALSLGPYALGIHVFDVIKA